MRSATAQMPQNSENLHHHVIYRWLQSGNNLISHPTGRHKHEQIRHRTDAVTHHQVSEVPPEMYHQHPKERRITWNPWNGTFWRWLKKRQQQPDMSHAYGYWHSTSSTNGLWRRRIKNIGIVKIYQTHESSTPTLTWCTPTQEVENKVIEILSRTDGAT